MYFLAAAAPQSNEYTTDDSTDNLLKSVCYSAFANVIRQFNRPKFSESVKAAESFEKWTDNSAKRKRQLKKLTNE